MKTNPSHPDSQDLGVLLVDRIKSISSPEGTVGRYVHGEGLFSYCSLDKERLAAVKLPCPVIGIVMQGRKEVWLGDRLHELAAGNVFVLPANVAMDVVNVPGGRRHVYESLLLEVPELPAGLAPLTGEEKRRRRDRAVSFIVPLDMDIVNALTHAATSIANASLSEAVKTLRLMEVLTLFRPVAAAGPLFDVSLVEKVAWLFRSAPAENWTVEAVASHCGIGGSTLRRQLAEEGSSFRSLLRRERLHAGRMALVGGASSYAAAEAAGYASSSHFARRYRENFGQSPTGRNS